MLTVTDRDGARRLLLDGDPFTPTDLQVRAVLHADDDRITFTANPIDDATSLHVWQRTADGSLDSLTDEPGVHRAVDRRFHDGAPQVIARRRRHPRP